LLAAARAASRNRPNARATTLPTNPGRERDVSKPSCGDRRLLPVNRPTEDQLSTWTKPAFANEEQRATETEQTIRQAVQNHPLLRDLDIKVFAKGSYKNNTNVRRDSDIDIAVEYRGMFTAEFSNGASFAGSNITPYDGPFKDEGGKARYKHAVGEALRTAFGSSAVDGSGNKVFEVQQANHDLAADVIPCTSHHDYWANGHFREGIELILDQPDGKRHTNYPVQHYDNGVAKNLATNKRFKRAVRIMKNIEGRLVADSQIDEIPSYLMECLAYNVSNEFFARGNTWREIVSNVSAAIWA
jgi:hypothetical protein